jgi:iron complex transport system ATP-binding protein
MATAHGEAPSGLLAEAIGVRLGGRPVLRGLALERVRRGELVAVVGPNAAGKSTFFKVLAGVIPAEAGRMVLDGVDLARLSLRERARRVGLLPQDGVAAYAALTVFEAVLLAAKQGGGGGWQVGAAELERVELALASVGVAELGMRWLAGLSGGQRQMVALAQALVQEPDVLLLDEPTSALDLQHQLDLLELVQARCRERGLIALAALHDLNLAARFADRIAVLAGGRIVAFGPPEAVLTHALLAQVYGVEVAVGRDCLGHVIITPLRSLRRDAAATPSPAQEGATG